MPDSINQKPIVVIPVHRDVPLRREIVSIEQCARILGEHEITFLCPEGLQTNAYLSLIPGASFTRVNASWMGSVMDYNRLIVSSILFERFHDYSHILLHEPDAIVIKDELLYWCQQPYDYIGAPWFEGYARADDNSQILGVGNSGFSLFRVAAAQYVTTSNARWYTLVDLIRDLGGALDGNWSVLKRAILCIGNRGKFRDAWKVLGGMHCDYFWSIEVPKAFPQFRIGSVEDALKFSWETLPSRCMALNGGMLPFGLHAWTKYDFEFLRPHLIRAGVPKKNLQGLT